jgi:hypothetical protein
MSRTMSYQRGAPNEWLNLQLPLNSSSLQDIFAAATSNSWKRMQRYARKKSLSLTS